MDLTDLRRADPGPVADPVAQRMVQGDPIPYFEFRHTHGSSRWRCGRRNLRHYGCGYGCNTRLREQWRRHCIVSVTR